jgi:predicted transposase YdaD
VDTDKQRATLTSVFVSLLVQHFLNLSQTEINTMLNLPSLKKTVAGREVYDEGRTEGRTEGIAEGIAEGVVDVVKRLAAKRFGKITPQVSAKLKELDYRQLEDLVEVILDLPDSQALDHWLSARVSERPQ